MILGKLAPTKESFKEQFGYGSQKKNRVFLSVYKHLLKNGNLDFFSITSDSDTCKQKFITELVEFVKLRINRSWPMNVDYRRTMLGNFPITSTTIVTDGIGLTDGPEFVSFRQCTDPNKRQKLRAGKFMRRLLQEHKVDQMFGDVFMNFYIEIFVQEWKSLANADDYTLKVDSDFSFIYNSYNYADNLGSCMTDEGFETFYEYYVDASAASLLDENGKILSRCIVYNDVKIQDPDSKETKSIRLAERQYSSRSDQIYSQMLVDKLKKAKLIDGWKAIGAGAGSARAFEMIDQTSVYDKVLYICLGPDYTVHCTTPYMDSFKYLNVDTNIAYNSSSVDFHYCLEETNGAVIEEDCENWDEYNEEYTDSELTTVRIYDDRGNYTNYMVSEEYAGSYLEYSEYLDSYIDGSVHSDVIDDYVPSICIDILELEFKQRNWEYDMVEGEYVDEEITIVHIFNSIDSTYDIKYTSVNNLYKYIELDGNYYDELTEELQEHTKIKKEDEVIIGAV